MTPQEDTDSVRLVRLEEQNKSLLIGINDLKTEFRRLNDQALDRRVSLIEDNLRWLTRTVVGLLLGVPVAIIIAVVTNH